MGLALWVLLGATTSQMRREEHNSRNSSYLVGANLAGRRAEGGREVCYRRGAFAPCSVRGVQRKSQV